MSEAARFPILCTTVVTAGLLAGCVIEPGASALQAARGPADEAGAAVTRSGGTLEDLIRQGDKARAAGDLEAAVGFYRAAHLKDRGRRDVVLRFGAALAALNTHGESGGALDLGLASGPMAREDAATRLNAPLGARAPRKPDTTPRTDTESPDPFLAALKLEPDARTYNGAAVALDREGRHREAQSYYRAGLDVEPDDLTLINNLGLSLVMSGDFPEAIDTLKKAASHPKATPDQWHNLALAYRLAGHGAAAARIVAEGRPMPKAARDGGNPLDAPPVRIYPQETTSRDSGNGAKGGTSRVEGRAAAPRDTAPAEPDDAGDAAPEMPGEDALAAAGGSAILPAIRLRRARDAGDLEPADSGTSGTRVSSRVRPTPKPPSTAGASAPPAPPAVASVSAPRGTPARELPEPSKPPAPEARSVGHELPEPSTPEVAARELPEPSVPPPPAPPAAMGTVETANAGAGEDDAPLQPAAGAAVNVATRVPEESRAGASPRQDLQAAADHNYAAFQAMLPRLLETHRGQYALLRDGEVVGFFETAGDAMVRGYRHYPDRRFSIQRVTDGSAS